MNTIERKHLEHSINDGAEIYFLCKYNTIQRVTSISDTFGSHHQANLSNNSHVFLHEHELEEFVTIEPVYLPSDSMNEFEGLGA